MARDKLNQDRLKNLLHYDAETGIFRWRVSRGNVKKTAVAGHPYQGRIVIRVFGKGYRAARLAWLYQTGSWPKEQIDHIDRNSLNDRWDNLRDVSHARNMQNCARPNETGYRCVWKSCGKYNARVSVGRTRIYLGRYKTAVHAHEIYKQIALIFYGPDASTDCK